MHVDSKSPYLDWKCVTDCTQHTDLPHISQPNVIQFVTFRLADSLPQSVLSELRKMHERAKENCGSVEEQRSRRRLIMQREQQWLDAGYGSCVLRRGDCREVLAESIMSRDGVDYNLLAYVIMPNHVHMLAQMIGDADVYSVVTNVKRVAARGINMLAGRKGGLWQKECHDRAVRNVQHLINCLHYIEQNPRGLPPDEFTLWVDRSRLNTMK